MSEPKNQLEDLPQSEVELTPEQTEGVGGGASDYLLEIDGVKGESKGTTPRPSGGITKTGPGTLAFKP